MSRDYDPDDEDNYPPYTERTKQTAQVDDTNYDGPADDSDGTLVGFIKFLVVCALIGIACVFVLGGAL